MKTKELIRQLQEADPSGELECCIDNHDIHSAERMPAYWDGRLEVLIRDPELTGKCFDVVGAKITAVGDKIKIHYLPIEDFLFDKPDAPVSLVELGNPTVREEYERRVEEWRAAGRDGDLS